MKLDPEFKRNTVALIRDSLDMYRNADAVPRMWKVWACENRGDFLCGFFVGYMFGMASDMFHSINKRVLSGEETAELFEVIEGYSGEITRCFARFNGPSFRKG